MTIDNSEKIKNILKFSDGGFFIIYVYQRYKDREGAPSRGAFVREHDKILSYYFVKDKETFDHCFELAKKEAIETKSRVYVSTFRINGQDLMDKLGIDLNGEPHAWRFEKGFLHDAFIFMDYFYTLIDVDEEYADRVEDILARVKILANYSGDGSIFAVPTKHGYHIVSPSFNGNHLLLKYPFLYITFFGGVMLYYFSEQD
jgi:hypothetical protein